MPPLAPSAVAPTGFRRWTPTLSMMLVSMISYVDRQTLALLSPRIHPICSRCRPNGVENYGFAHNFSNESVRRRLLRRYLRSSIPILPVASKIAVRHKGEAVGRYRAIMIASDLLPHVFTAKAAYR